MGIDDPAGRVRAIVVRDYRDLLDAVGGTAEIVASGWEDDVAVERAAVAGPLERELDRRGILDRFPGLIADVVNSTGFELPASPVAGPPYVVITATGPVLRATVPAGRFVIDVRVFEIDRNPVRYRLRSDDPADALEVSFVTTE